VGIELSWGSVQRLVRRADAGELGNLRVLQGDAVFLVDRLFASGSLSGAYVNFSDPWRKPRHHRRRLVRPDFVALLATRLAPGAETIIATDHAEYADWIAEVLESQTALVPALGATRVGEIPGRRPTRYESKAREAGTPISYFVWRRGPLTPSPEALVDKVEAMPNVNLQGSFPTGGIFDPEPRVFTERHRGEEVVIKLTALYRHQTRPEWLVATLVKEGPFPGRAGRRRSGQALRGRLPPPYLGGEARGTAGGGTGGRRAPGTQARLVHGGHGIVRDRAAQRRRMTPGRLQDRVVPSITGLGQLPGWGPISESGKP
jgi:tRNA (guanine-N(7)-)-methyltransferase